MGTSCPGSLPAHPHLADVHPVEPGDGGRRGAQAIGSPSASATYRDGLRAPTTTRSPSRTRRRCATATRRSSSFPGSGSFGFGKDKREARITTEFFVNAIHVMAGANALGEQRAGRRTRCCRRSAGRSRRSSSRRSSNYVALPRLEAFRIEYWALEEAKLQRMPPEREFSREVAVVVGGGSGIGREVALQIARRGGHVVVADAEHGRRARRRRGRRRSSSNAEMVHVGGARSDRRARRSPRRCARRSGSSAASTSWSTPRPSIRRRDPSTPAEEVWAQDAADQRDVELSCWRRKRRRCCRRRTCRRRSC